MRKTARKNYVWVGYFFTGLFALAAAGVFWVYLDQHAFFCPQVRQARCIGNLERIVEAKALYAGEHPVAAGAPITAEQIVEVIEGGWKSLRCPGRGTYTIQPVGTDPQCSEAGHQL
jgi:hypothetical protein